MASDAALMRRTASDGESACMRTRRVNDGTELASDRSSVTARTAPAAAVTLRFVV